MYQGTIMDKGKGDCYLLSVIITGDASAFCSQTSNLYCLRDKDSRMIIFEFYFPVNT